MAPSYRIQGVHMTTNEKQCAPLYVEFGKSIPDKHLDPYKRWGLPHFYVLQHSRNIMSHDIRNLQDASKKIKEICNTDGSQSKFYPSDGTMSCAFCLTLLRLFFVVPLSSGYKDCVSHYFQSSSKVAHSAVQPGSVSDLIKIVSKSFSLLLDSWRLRLSLSFSGECSQNTPSSFCRASYFTINLYLLLNLHL
jgi:hypothetical protein